MNDMPPMTTEDKPSSGAHNRRNPRRNIGILAALTTNENKLIGFGAVKNVSADGAKIVLSDEFELPGQFIVTLSNKSGPRRICEVMWRNEKAVGVRFLPSHDK